MSCAIGAVRPVILGLDAKESMFACILPDRTHALVGSIGPAVQSASFHCRRIDGAIPIIFAKRERMILHPNNPAVVIANDWRGSRRDTGGQKQRWKND